MIRRFSKKRQDNRKFYRVNDRIFASSLRVLDSEGKQVGPTVLKGVPYRVEAADEDGDNNLDLRFTNEQDGGVQVFLGDGKGNFTLPPERGR